MLRHDLAAGLTVAVVALPLAMAFGIAAGATPEQGLYTAIIAGFLASLFGGSKFQISGPTGAFVVIIYETIQKHGYDGLVLATLCAGAVLILCGFCRLGTLIQFIPYPLVTGFTAGIAVLIFSGQVKDLLGLPIDSLPGGFTAQWSLYLKTIPLANLPTVGLGLGGVIVILLLRRFLPKLPWGITVIAIITVLAWALDLSPTTIGSRFGAVPRMLPQPGLPDLSVAFGRIHQLLPDILVIAFLAGIESLLSAAIADGMTGEKHKSDIELIGQGIANIGAVAFMGIPACGALARTAINIHAGGKSPLAGIAHALLLLLIMLLFAPLVGKIPLTALSAVLVVVAWNMSEVKHIKKLLRAPRSDQLILFTTFFSTILIDLTVAVGAGMILAAFSFLKQMAEFPLHFVTKEGENGEVLPKDVEVYDLHGPLFFGVAGRLQEILDRTDSLPKACILRMGEVTLVDASGVHALTELFHRFQKKGVALFLTEVSEKSKKVLDKTGFLDLLGKDHHCVRLSHALAKAEKIH